MTIAEGTVAVVPFTVDERQMETFADLSGDRNPLHTDETFARGIGFAGRVVYGALLLAQVSRLLGDQLPGSGCVWQSLTFAFRAPLYVGEPACLTATVVHYSAALHVYELKLAVTAGERLIATGRAQAQLRRSQ